MSKPKGFIIDKGASPMDGKPFVAILTLSSINRKTGDMAQVWILRDDINPVDAIAKGEDYSICGNCPHRGTYSELVDRMVNRSCYVNVGQAPSSVWKTYQRAGYINALTSKDAWCMMRDAIKGKRIRWGAYGDPSVIDPAVVDYINEHSDGHTGYTHQWREPFAQVFKGIFQASCDGFNDYLNATAQGWKTFTVVNKTASIAYAKQCPATVENSQAQCATCKLCDGARTDIYVTAHGTGAKYVTAA